jgi:hypothetical protein
MQMAHGLSQVMKRRGVTFHQAWDILVGTGQIVMLEDIPGDAAADDTSADSDDVAAADDTTPPKSPVSGDP